MSLIEDLRQRKTYLDTAAVMTLLTMSRNTLCSFVRSGKISAIRAGNGYLFDPGVLADWLEARSTAPLKRAA